MSIGINVVNITHSVKYFSILLAKSTFILYVNIPDVWAKIYSTAALSIRTFCDDGNVL